MYTLILTLILKVGYAGMGGIGIIPNFKTLSDCEQAGQRWTQQASGESHWLKNSKSFYICEKTGEV